MSERPVSSATTLPDFQLQSLGWKAFQDLCLTILSDQLGQAVKRFAATNDGGRDGAFIGVWKPTPALELSGETVVQCKFTSRVDTTLTISAFEEEFQKAEKLWKRRKRDNYILLTNNRLSAEFEEQAAQRFASIGCANFHAFGYEWIAGAIQSSARLRTLVPRLYGLGDLSQILDERWYLQTQKLLEAERDNLRKFVPTRAYRQAVDALNDYGFVLLLGDPAVGKTAIAATLTLASGDAWKCRPMKLEHAQEIRDRWNPEDPKQLFWIDDAFGALQYDAARVQEWNATFSWLDAVLKSGAKIILTSRNYIYEHARRDLKQTAFPLLRESQVVVNVSDLTQRERDQILYNHVRLGDQPSAWRRRFKVFFELAARHASFGPEIARRLGSQAFTKQLAVSSSGIDDFIANQEEFLRDTLTGLSTDDKAALAAVFLRGGVLKSPVDLSDAELAILARLGGTPKGITDGLAALRGGFVRFTTVDQDAWMFKHPTIGDAFASLLSENPEFVDLYIAGASIDKVLNEVTCGNVGLEHVSVVVPSSRFETMIQRLHGVAAEKSGTLDDVWHRQRRYYDFLADRCSAEFLRNYIDATPDFWDQVLNFGSYLGAMPQFALLATLRQFKMVREAQKAAILKKVAALAVETPDADFLTTQRIRRFFTTSEIDTLMTLVRDELVPNLSDTLESWRDNYSSSEDPTAYLSPLVEALRAFAEYFENDSEAHHDLSRAANRVETWMSELESEREPDDDYYDHDDFGGGGRSAGSDVPTRPIYDDLDE